jgi:hypothetical protein
MTLNQLASLIAKREGRKHEASIGDVREIVKLIVEIQSEFAARLTNETFLPAFWMAVEKRTAVLTRKRKRAAKRKSK